MAKHYFGMLQGPFNINENILSKIEENHPELENESFKIIKLGICVYRKFDLITPYNWNYYGEMEPHMAEEKVEEGNSTYSLLKLSQQPIIVQIKAVGEDNIKSFRLGITNILELEDVNLESISFHFDQEYWNEVPNHWTKTDDSIYINYIIEKE